MKPTLGVWGYGLKQNLPVRNRPVSFLFAVELSKSICKALCSAAMSQMSEGVWRGRRGLSDIAIAHEEKYIRAGDPGSLISIHSLKMSDPTQSVATGTVTISGKTLTATVTESVAASTNAVTSAPDSGAAGGGGGAGGFNATSNGGGVANVTSTQVAPCPTCTDDVNGGNNTNGTTGTGTPPIEGIAPNVYVPKAFVALAAGLVAAFGLSAI